MQPFGSPALGLELFVPAVRARFGIIIWASILLDLEPFGLPGLDLEPFAPPELDSEPFGPPGLDLKAFRFWSHLLLQGLIWSYL